MMMMEMFFGLLVSIEPEIFALMREEKYEGEAL